MSCWWATLGCVICGLTYMRPICVIGRQPECVLFVGLPTWDSYGLFVGSPNTCYLWAYLHETHMCCWWETLRCVIRGLTYMVPIRVVVAQPKFVLYVGLPMRDPHVLLVGNSCLCWKWAYLYETVICVITGQPKFVLNVASPHGTPLCYCCATQVCVIRGLTTLYPSAF